MTRSQIFYKNNKEYFVEYRKKNRQKMIEISKRWRLKNPEKVKEMNKNKWNNQKLKIFNEREPTNELYKAIFKIQTP